MRVLITGGGTGGHIYPGLAIAGLLKKHNRYTEILFVGSDNGLEVDLVPSSGYDLKTISIKGFERKISIKTLYAAKELVKAFFQTKKIINAFKPDIVVGTGGYVCGPVVLIAAYKKIPTIIHEQNVIPGITNRILSKFVDIVALSFNESKIYFKQKEKLIVTGNPLRQGFKINNREKSITKLKLEQNKKTILVFGGSRGAKTINFAVNELIESIGKNSRLQLLFITGKSQYNSVLSALNHEGIDISQYGNIKIKPYLDNIHDALSAADLIISRAGATTIAEITALGKPAILIPLKIAANNHQELNSGILKDIKAAEVILEKDLHSKILIEKIETIIYDDIKLARMAKNSKKLGKLNAAESIVNLIYKLTK